MNWSFHKRTTTAIKLPNNWMEQGLYMNYRIAYLVKVYTIPPCLVINSDKSRIHLGPLGGGRTLDVNGVKDVKILGLEDKRQITCIVSSNASGKLLPSQLIFTGTTVWCLLKFTEEKTRCIHERWHLTYSANHWSILETSKQFVGKVLHPFLTSMINLHNLPKNQRLVWLIDSWLVHKSSEFLD